MQIRSVFLILFIFNLLSCSYLPEENMPNTGWAISETSTFIEISNNPLATIGIIFYGGGLVDAHAYLPLLSGDDFNKLSLKNFIVKMPLNLAVFDVNEAKNIIKQFPEIKNWYIAGHSLGGVMACSLVNKNRDLFEGLILLAAYPANNTNLSGWNAKVVSLRGSNDLLTTQEDIDGSKDRLPLSTEYILIEGGNHANFGSYGVQKDDGINELIEPTQIDITIKKIVEFIL